MTGWKSLWNTLVISIKTCNMHERGWGSQTKRQAQETWTEIVDNDMDDLHIELSDALDRCKRTGMIRGNWSDRSSDSEAESWIWTVRFWCRLNQVNLDLWAVKWVCFVCCLGLMIEMYDSWKSCLSLIFLYAEHEDRIPSTDSVHLHGSQFGGCSFLSRQVWPLKVCLVLFLVFPGIIMIMH